MGATVYEKEGCLVRRPIEAMRSASITVRATGAAGAWADFESHLEGGFLAAASFASSAAFRIFACSGLT